MPVPVAVPVPVLPPVLPPFLGLLGALTGFLGLTVWTRDLPLLKRSVTATGAPVLRAAVAVVTVAPPSLLPSARRTAPPLATTPKTEVCLTKPT